MRRSLILALIAALAFAGACRKSQSPPSDAKAEAAKAGDAADEAPPSLDTPSVMQTIREGDPANILEVLKLMTADREGWAAGDYADLIRPLWNLFVRQSSPQADAASTEVERRVANLFNFGDWYPILEDLLLVAADKSAQPGVRQAAAEHFWRFAVKDKAAQGFAIPAADRPRIEKVVLALLDEPDDSLQGTAAQTAAALGSKAAVPKLKAIAARPGDSAEIRGLRYEVGEALFALGETGAGLGVMQALAGSKGDFSDEAAEFLKKNEKK